MLRDLQQRHPHVYVKSRAKGFEEGEEVRITLTAAGPDDDSAAGSVRAAFADLRSALDRLGLVIVEPL
jgi:hypothetical protein